MSDFAIPKPGAKDWTIKEQIIRDPASGLTLQFDVLSDGSARLRIFGESLPFGNREIGFVNGIENWGGTTVVPCHVPPPGWITGKVAQP